MTWGEVKTLFGKTPKFLWQIILLVKAFINNFKAFFTPFKLQYYITYILQICFFLIWYLPQFVESMASLSWVVCEKNVLTSKVKTGWLSARWFVKISPNFQILTFFIFNFFVMIQEYHGSVHNRQDKLTII